MATPTPAPAPAPAPQPAPQPPPGWKSSEHWLAFVVILLNGLISSGIVGSASELAKIIGLSLNVLAALGYGMQRTMLKVAHVRAFGASNDNAAVPIPVPTAQAGFVRMPLLALLALLALALGAAGQLAGCHTKAGQVVLQTGQCVLDAGVLGTIVLDLASQNYAQLVADAVTKFGPALVTCALQAIAASEQPAAGSGSATAARGAYDALTVQRAKEMLAKYGAGR
ncbi:MAG TPA: hypothetical protein VES97_02150 [Solirubrobacteraceae bacterium]|nr:hypothetical protein [Solirubrobacteraceae bacterium]